MLQILQVLYWWSVWGEKQSTWLENGSENKLISNQPFLDDCACTTDAGATGMPFITPFAFWNAGFHAWVDFFFFWLVHVVCLHQGEPQEIIKPVPITHTSTCTTYTKPTSHFSPAYNSTARPFGAGSTGVTASLSPEAPKVATIPSASSAFTPAAPSQPPQPPFPLRSGPAAPDAAPATSRPSPGRTTFTSPYAASSSSSSSDSSSPARVAAPSSSQANVPQPSVYNTPINLYSNANACEVAMGQRRGLFETHGLSEQLNGYVPSPPLSPHVWNCTHLEQPHQHVAVPVAPRGHHFTESLWIIGLFMPCSLHIGLYEGKCKNLRCIFLSFQIFIQSKNNISCHAAGKPKACRTACLNLPWVENSLDDMLTDALLSAVTAEPKAEPSLLVERLFLISQSLGSSRLLGPVGSRFHQQALAHCLHGGEIGVKDEPLSLLCHLRNWDRSLVSSFLGKQLLVDQLWVLSSAFPPSEAVTLSVFVRSMFELCPAVLWLVWFLSGTFSQKGLFHLKTKCLWLFHKQV